MDLAQALKVTKNHPPASERGEILRSQLSRFRQEFYGHVTDLQRFADFEKRDGKLGSERDAHVAVQAAVEKHGESASETVAAQGRLDLVRAKLRAERALDTIHHAIEATLSELQILEPDAE